MTRTLTYAWICTLICTLLMTWIALKDSFGGMDLIPTSRYTSARAAALGDAFLPLADDGIAGLFYNPSLLVKPKDFTFEFVNASFYGNSNYFTKLDGNFFKILNLEGFLPTLQAHRGSFFGSGLAIVPAFYTRGFAIGILANFQSGAQANFDDTIRYKSLYQIIPTIGTSVAFFKQLIRIGYSLQWVNQSSGDLDTAITASPLGYNQNLSQGSALSHTLGITVQPPLPYIPTLSIVGRNLFTARFQSFSLMSVAQNPSSPPPDEPMTFDASLSFAPEIGNLTIGNFVFEILDMTQQSGVPIYGRLAVGIELVFTQSSPWLFTPGTGNSSSNRTSTHFYLRAGWSSGFPSAGFGFKSRAFDLSFAGTNRDIGAYYHELQDFRAMVQFQYRPNLN